MPFESEEARAINREIFETMYFAAMTASCELAEKEGAYETFEGSPVSKGIFQFDMWGEVRRRPSPRRGIDGGGSGGGVGRGGGMLTMNACRGDLPCWLRVPTKPGRERCTVDVPCFRPDPGCLCFTKG